MLQKRVVRFPKFYSEEVSKILTRHLGIHSDGGFCTERSSPHLIRIVCTHYYLWKKLEEKKLSSNRPLFLKSFKSNFKGKTVLSLAFSVHLFHAYELVEEKHIMKVLARYLPGIKSIQGSFFSCLKKQDLSLFCYIEIEKLRGHPITSKDISLLRRKFAHEMVQSIQSLTPSLLIPYHEEAVYKTIVQLAKEVIKDLPQVKISFQSQSQDLLYFHLIVVRYKEAPLSYELSTSSIRLKMQKTIALGSSRKAQKEALIFLAEIDSHLFLRKNWAIDLRQARNYLVKVLEQVLGPFRDYDGGLISQQNQQFEKLRENLDRKYENFHFIFADCFYSIHPPVLQTFISIPIAKQLLTLLVSLFNKDFSEEDVLFGKKKMKNAQLLLVKTRCIKKRDYFLNHIQKISEQASPYFGYSSIEYEGNYYLYLLDLSLNPSHLIERIEMELKTDLHFDDHANKNTLKLNLQEGDPPSLNPHLADRRCRTLCKALFEGLFRLNEQGLPEPAAAKSFQISSCQTVYKFLLREHHWSNGEIVTAYDFEHSWKKALLQDSHCVKPDLFYVIKNARKSRQGSGHANDIKVNAVNAKTLIVELEYPVTNFPHLLAHPIFSPLRRKEEEPIHFNGPFIIKEWVRDRHLKLTANPFYWDRNNVHVQDILISMVQDFNVINEMFKNEQLDWMGEPFNQLPFQLNAPCSKGCRLIRRKINRAYWLYLNAFSFPLQSAHIRKAFSFAIDRKAIAAESFNEVTPQFGLILEKGVRQPYKKYDGNILLAQQAFEEGLKELNLTRSTFPEIVFHYPKIPNQKQIVQSIQKQIQAALNIPLILKPVGSDSLLNLLDTNHFQMAACFVNPPDLFASKWENRNFQALFDLALQIEDPKIKAELFKKAEKIFLAEMPVIPIFRTIHRCLLHKRITNSLITDSGDVDLKWIKL